MGIHGPDGEAGGFAHDRFVDRRRAWRRRFWWVFALIAMVPVIIELPVAALTGARHVGFAFGFGLGAGLAAALVLFDSPPHHIESWRIGSDGEKATARQLRRLVKQGWMLFNDIETAHGNIDHVLVGPAGVFMLESKRLSGRVRVEAGKLVVSWHEDPDDGYENGSIGGRARGAAFELHSRLGAAGVDVWVQPVVVLWADFEQRSIVHDGVAYVRGGELATVIAARPETYTAERIPRLTSATRTAVQGPRQPVPASSAAHLHPARA